MYNPSDAKAVAQRDYILLYYPTSDYAGYLRDPDYFILKKQVIQHQKFAIRSFALTLSAISLRLFKYLLVFFFEPLPMDAYRIAAWSSWTFNLLVAELIIYYKFSRISK